MPAKLYIYFLSFGQNKLKIFIYSNFHPLYNSINNNNTTITDAPEPIFLEKRKNSVIKL